MSRLDCPLRDPASLRKCAEEMAKAEQPSLESISPEEIGRILHELLPVKDISPAKGVA